jgi:hypothetical protein
MSIVPLTDPYVVSKTIVFKAGFTGETAKQGSLFSEVRQRDQLNAMVRQLEARGDRTSPLYQIRDLEPWSRIPERRQVMVRFNQ